MADQNLNQQPPPINSVVVELQRIPSSTSNGPLNQLHSPSLPSSIASTITSNPSSPPNKPFIHANHYNLLMQDSTTALEQDVSDGLNIGELIHESGNSTVLHIAATVGQSDTFLRFIVSQSRDLLCTPNLKGDLPVHVATRAGHLRVVKTLVELADQEATNVKIKMLESENKDNNTCLHIALENRQMEMAEFLFEKCPQTFCYVNVLMYSPIYLAIKAGFRELVGKMIGERDAGDRNPDEELLKGKSVVHAAIMAQNTEILEKVLEYRHLLYSDRSIDEKGRRALSYAAYIGFTTGVRTIINMKENAGKNEAFKRDEDGSFPIHMACKGGHIQIIKEILRLSEKMKWLLNIKGQSILHVAAESGKLDVVNYLIKQPTLLTMLNMKDQDGYTPLHLAVKGKHPKVVYALTWDSRINSSLQSNDGSTALDLAEDYGDVPSFEERLTWLALKYAGVPKSPQVIQSPNTQITIDDRSTTHGLILNNGNYCIPATTTTTTFHNKRKNKYKDRINTLLIIATLVATVTYASGFAVPGGYNNNDSKHHDQQGMATLVHKSAFDVFIICNAIAMHSAILAIFTLIWAHLDDLRLMLLSLHIALPLIGVSVIMMSIAFMFGLFVVLHDLVWLRFLVLGIQGLFVVALFVFVAPLVLPMVSCGKGRVLRYVIHYPFTLMLLASKDISKCDKLF